MFFQTSDKLDMRLQKSEVSATKWVPLEFFLMSRSDRNQEGIPKAYLNWNLDFRFPANRIQHSKLILQDQEYGRLTNDKNIIFRSESTKFEFTQWRTISKQECYG